MKLFHFKMPPDTGEYAEAIARGTWAPDPGPGLCPECGHSRQYRVPPLILQWMPGSDRVADFTWAGAGAEVVVTQRVRDVLESAFKNIRFLGIEIWQPPKLPRPSDLTRRKKRRVWLPYDGPALWDLQPESRSKIDQNRSNVKLLHVCKTCGRMIWDIPQYGQRTLVVDRSTWDGAHIFRLDAYPYWVFCTDMAREFIERQRFTNVTFELDGIIPD